MWATTGSTLTNNLFRMIDAHVHPYQVRRDAQGPEEFAQAAFEKGLDGLVFTEHAPLWYPEPRLHFMTEPELLRCIEDCLATKARWVGRLDIRVGEPCYIPRIGLVIRGVRV